MSFEFLAALLAALWLCTIVACLVAWRWSFVGLANRFWASVVLSVAALVVGYAGLTRFRISASKTVNGHTQWRFDSHWFFIATTVVAAATLAYTLWKRLKSAPSVAASQLP